MLFDILRLIKDGVITMEDLFEFSDELLSVGEKSAKKDP
jgi:hypothetical protein